MSNLGGYQILTSFAKKVGGPGKLVALIAGSGAVVGGIAVKGVEFAIKKSKKAISDRRIENNKTCKNVQVEYFFNKDGESNERLKLKKGKSFRVLDTDGEAVLIELVGNKENPYFVSKDLLEQISNYKENCDNI